MPRAVLLILDGFGASSVIQGNAILSAKTPNLDWLWSHYPRTLIKAAEEEVGLHFGHIGNSEVGHMAIGAGRVIPSPLQRIDSAIEDKSFFSNKAFLEAIYTAKTHSTNLHLIGLASSAGVHGDLGHLIALLELAKQNGMNQVYIHLILDGRDTGPREAPIYIRKLNESIMKLKIGTLATIAGRSWAMDRNKNWGRTKTYYDTLCGISYTRSGQSALGIVEDSYMQRVDDENITPSVIREDGLIHTGDVVIITNFRVDRARQITQILSNPSFANLPGDKYPRDLTVVTMTHYSNDLPVKAAFPPIKITNTLSDILEHSGLSQLHIAETEKYAHVTYFLNGGREKSLPHEQFVNIPSDPPEFFLENPSMKADIITQEIVNSIQNNTHDIIIANYANADMIGHTGDFNKTVLAVECIDRCIGTIASEVLKQDSFLIVTADHGNAEQKINLKTNEPSKEHTVNPVPFIVASSDLQKNSALNRITQQSTVTGILQDVAPTILTYLGIAIPEEMTGTNVFSAQLP